MLHIVTKSPRRRLVMGVIAALAAICLMLITTLGALADTVNISDKASVLNASQVQSEAAKLPYPVNIYTMNNFTGSESAFNQEAVRTLNDAHNPRLIIIAIDTHNRFLAIVGGKEVSTSNSVYNDAVNAFKNNYNGGDYTGATIAALHSLQNSLGGSTGSGISNPAAGFSLLPLCIIGLVVLGLIVFAGMFFIRRARRQIPPYPMGGQYQQPFNQGYTSNNYGPGYYQQRPGMNPWAAGGLGAAAGGLIGYELGKHEGEEQANQGGGDFGGGAGGTFGGDGGGDFGGGAGGDFGGGGGGDFGGGGGGDFGGGGGSSF